MGSLLKYLQSLTREVLVIYMDDDTTAMDVVRFEIRIKNEGLKPFEELNENIQNDIIQDYYFTINQNI